MASFQQYIFQQGQTPSNIDTTSYSTWEAISSSLQNFSQTLRAREQVATKEAQIQHTKDITTFVNQSESDIITSINEISVNSGDNYELYNTQAQALKSAFLEGEDDPDKIQAVSIMIDDKIAQYGQDVYKNWHKNKEEDAKAAANININDHMIDTEHLITQTITDFNELINDPTTEVQLLENPNLITNYFTEVSKKMGLQRNTFIEKINNLLKFDIDPEVVYKKEQEILNTFYKSAAMAEFRSSIESGNAWETIQEFNESPEKFFNRAHIQAIFQDETIKLNEKDKGQLFEDMLSELTSYQKQEDRVEAELEAIKKVEQDETYVDQLNEYVKDPNSLNQRLIQDLYKHDEISNTHRNDLLKIMTSGAYYEEDANVVSQLYEQLFDPNADQFDIYESITSAMRNKQILPSTQAKLLKDLRSGNLSNITNDEEYKIAIAEIKTEYRTTGLLAAFDTNESKRINNAIREIYELKRTITKEQDFWNEFERIKTKYSRTGSSTAVIPTWDPSWRGTANKPDFELTKAALRKKYNNTEYNMTLVEYEKEFARIVAFEELFNKRQKR